MNRKRIKELLADHAEQLIRENLDNSAGNALPGEEDAELFTLMDVAEKVKSALTPVAPPKEFETDLKQQLVTAAHIRQLEGYTPPNPERDLLIVMGVIAFILSLIGVLVAWQFRSQHA
ncbi:MAG: hypothetical protein D6784_13320 [Chloroflexi bacterium]|nr:MAG: hypothetical protein D6784_13320 [Chloroflexota bacterium]